MQGDEVRFGISSKSESRNRYVVISAGSPRQLNEDLREAERYPASTMKAIIKSNHHTTVSGSSPAGAMVGHGAVCAAVGLVLTLLPYLNCRAPAECSPSLLYTVLLAGEVETKIDSQQCRA